MSEKIELERLLQMLATRNQNLGNLINAAVIAHQDNTALLQRLADMVQVDEAVEEEAEE